MAAAKRAPLPAWWWNQSLALRRLIAVAMVIVLVLLGVWAYRSVTATTPSEAVAFVDDLPPERVETWDDLAQCETNGNWAENSGNGYYGGLQMTLQSWEWMGGTGFPHEWPREEQIMRAEMLYDEQAWAAWPACSRELGLQ